MFAMAESDFCQQSSHRWSTFESEWRPVFKVKHKSWKFSHSKSTSALRWIKYFSCSLKQYVPKYVIICVWSKRRRGSNKSHVDGKFNDWSVSACSIFLVRGGRELCYFSCRLDRITRHHSKSTTRNPQHLLQIWGINDLVNIANQNDKSSWRCEIRHT